MASTSYQQLTVCLSSFFILQLLIVVTAAAAAAVHEGDNSNTNNEYDDTERSLQAGAGFTDGGSSGGSSDGSGAEVVGILAISQIVQSNPKFFKSPGGIFVIILMVGALVGFSAWRKGLCKKWCQKNDGDAPAEAQFFEKNDTADNDGTNNDEESGDAGNFDLPFYSGIYTGFYDQRGARMPVQPFELYFQETSLDTGGDLSDDDDDDDDIDAVDTGPDTKFHIISGKGADLVGPYSLSGKSVGNKVSITKKYYGQGNMSTDVGHAVTLRLDKLGSESHIFEGKWYVHTEGVNENGLYQIWPLGYMQNNAPPPPMAGMPPPPPEGYQQQQPSPPVDNYDDNNLPPPLPAVAVAAVAVATSASDDDGDGDTAMPVVAVATATPVDDNDAAAAATATSARRDTADSL